MRENEMSTSFSDDGFHVIVLVKGNDERFIFSYPTDEESILQLLKIIDGFKNNPEINFDELDEAEIRWKVAKYV
jgi:hypothetical protein